MSIEQLEDIEFGLTVRDPWAQAIIHGPKRIENRSKRPPAKIVGERIAVQTGKRFDEVMQLLHQPPKFELYGWGDYEFDDDDHHPGHIIGTVRVVGFCCEGEEVGKTTFRFTDPIGSVCKGWDVFTDCSDDELLNQDSRRIVIDDPWWQGPVGWLLDDPQPIDEPVPARGMPGVWNVAKQVEVAS